MTIITKMQNGKRMPDTFLMKKKDISDYSPMARTKSMTAATDKKISTIL